MDIMGDKTSTKNTGVRLFLVCLALVALALAVVRVIVLVYDQTQLSDASRSGYAMMPVHQHFAFSAGALVGAYLEKYRALAEPLIECPALGTCGHSDMPRRALVMTVLDEESLSSVLGLTLTIRSIGKWKHDILILANDEFAPLVGHLKHCFDVKIIEWSQEELNGFMRLLPQVKQDDSLWNLLALISPDIRNYDIVQVLDRDVVISGPLNARHPEDFANGETFHLEHNTFANSILLPNFVSSRVPDVGMFDPKQQNKDRTYLKADILSFLTWRFENVDATRQELAQCGRMLHSWGVRGNSAIVMLCFPGRWHASYIGGRWRDDISGFLKTSTRHAPNPDNLGYVRGEGPNRPSSPSSPLNGFFGLALAAVQEYCPAIGRVRMRAGSIPQQIDSSNALDDLAAYGAAIISAGRDEPLKIVSVKSMSGTTSPRRALVFTSRQKFLKGALISIFHARTLGEWRDDVILLTDRITNEEREHFKCLNVKIIISGFDNFQQRFPEARKNMLYFKLLPFFEPEIWSFYDIVQLMPDAGIVTGTIRAGYKADFAQTNIIDIERLGCADSSSVPDAYTSSYMINVHSSRLPKTEVLASRLDEIMRKHYDLVSSTREVFELMFDGAITNDRTFDLCEGIYPYGRDTKKPLRLTHVRTNAQSLDRDTILYHFAHELSENLMPCMGERHQPPQSTSM